MKMKINFKGLDKLQKKIDDAVEAVREQPGSERFTLANLLDDDFLKAHTNYSNYEELLNAAGYEMTSVIEDDDEAGMEQFRNKLTEAAGYESFDQLIADAYGMKLKIALSK